METPEPLRMINEWYQRGRELAIQVLTEVVYEIEEVDTLGDDLPDALEAALLSDDPADVYRLLTGFHVNLVSGASAAIELLAEATNIDKGLLLTQLWEACVGSEEEDRNG